MSTEREFSTPYYILRLDEVPEEISFYHLLLELSPYSRHIIGISRIADYKEKIVGRSIFIYCTSLIDARFMEQSYIHIVRDGRDAQAPTIVDSILGRAVIDREAFQNEQTQIPVSVHITGLEKQDKRTGGTDYLLRIVPAFESSATITGIRLSYDARKCKTLKDGFVTYLNWRDAYEVGGELEPKSHLVFGKVINATLSQNVPMVVRIPDSHIFDRGICEWSAEASRMNQLIATITPSRKSTNRNPQALPTIKTRTREQVPRPCSTISTTSSARSDTSKAPSQSTSAASAQEVVNRQKSASSNKIDKSARRIVRHKSAPKVDKQVEMYFDSTDDEVRLVKSAEKKAVKGPKKSAKNETSSSSSSDDDSRLIINEDVQLDEEELASTSRKK